MTSEVEFDIDLFGDQLHMFVIYERTESGMIDIQDVQIGAPILRSKQWRYQSILPFISSDMAFDLRMRIHKHLTQSHIVRMGSGGHAA